MDILKFGADVEVLAPPDLRRRVADEAARLTALYAAAPKAKGRRSLRPAFAAAAARERRDSCYRLGAVQNITAIAQQENP
jgi:hypothetical protein